MAHTNQRLGSADGQPIVQVTGLRKVYSRRRAGDLVAVDDLDLTLGQPGTVHGFLGPNGSGKTTTIRCLLGLIRPTSGSARVFGVDASTEFHKVASRVGAIVEGPKLFPNFSARRNLTLLARTGGIPKSEVDRVLEIVDLDGRDKDSFASYSMGMKQRLAIAAALLKNPDLLILDEPGNGLDPAGIAEVRRLIRQIATEGKAVLISSHQLAEMEQVCDNVTIINHGQLVKTGSLEHIRGFAGADQVLVTIPQRDAAIAALADAGIKAHPRPDAEEMVVDLDVSESSSVTKALADRGFYLSGLRSDRATLEAAFLNLTGGDAPPPPMTTPAPAPGTDGPPAASPPGGPPPAGPPPAGPPSGPPPSSQPLGVPPPTRPPQAGQTGIEGAQS